MFLQQHLQTTHSLSLLDFHTLQQDGKKHLKYLTTNSKYFLRARSWGRDTFISFTGLLLIPGHYAQAKEIILIYA